MNPSLPKKISYGTPLHRKVRDAILARWRFSRNELSKRYEQFTKGEEKFIAYLPEREHDRLRRQKREQGSPQYTTLEIPYSYAVAMTAHTYWSTVFLSRSPVFQYTARHGEPMQRVDAVEALVDYQVQVGGMLPAMFQWLLDPVKYGYGVAGIYWDEEKSTVSRIVEEEEMYLGVFKTGKKKKRRVVEEVAGYQGCRMYNVRPQDFFYDPRVSVTKFQDGEFVGRYVEVGSNAVLRRMQQGIYFNKKEYEESRARVLAEREQGSSQIQLPTQQGDVPFSNFIDTNDTGFVPLIEMYIELVPKDWELGDTEFPEKWVFVLAHGEVIVHASPLGQYHNKFPFAVLPYEVDMYSLAPRGMMEVMTPMQDLLTWLMNSHMQNVRKAINDMFVFDPSRIVTKDITDPVAGRYIRLKPDAYGTDVGQAIKQLQVVDVTKAHMQDAQTVMELVQRVVGVTDNVMGMLNPTGRRTATESRISTNFAANRLKTNAEFMSAAGWTPLAQMILQTTQQNYELERQFRIAGDTLRQGQPAFAQVDSESIQGFFDFVPVDGTMPVDKFALASLWKELLAQIAGSQGLAQMFDIPSIFSYTAKLAGAKNVDQFKLKITPDKQLAAQVQAGSSVPVPKGGEKMMEQIPGMGEMM